MNWTLREEIAKERFLDLMAKYNDQAHVEGLSKRAVREADILIAELNKAGEQKEYAERMAKMDATRIPAHVETKGCAHCFGSGGKKKDPCKHCKGTGRVPTFKVLR